MNGIDLTQKLQKIVGELLSKQHLFDEDIEIVQNQFIDEFYKTIELCFDRSVTPVDLIKFKEKGNINDICSILDFVSHITENEKSYIILNYFLLRYLQVCAQYNDQREVFINNQLLKYCITQEKLIEICNNFYNLSVTIPKLAN
jgi:hypothetical protein